MTIPSDIKDLLDQLVAECRIILREKYIGLYVHGSLAMDCFNPQSSDVDLLLVVDHALTDSEARSLLEVIVELNDLAPPKGIEISIITQFVLKPFVYPTPHELHFSPYHLETYHKNPGRYIEQRRSSDPDLAAHITILLKYGLVWDGPPIKQVFGNVSHEAYLDSVLLDLANPEQEILRDSTYVTLNLCRVLAYVREGLILSKAEGAQWALGELAGSMTPVISSALNAYINNVSDEVREHKLVAFVSKMMSLIHESIETKPNEAELRISNVVPSVETLEHFLYLAIFVPEGSKPPSKDILDLPELRIYVDDFGQREGDLAVGAWSGDELIGLAWVRKMEDYGYLNAETPSLSISIEPSWRSEGIGRKLMLTLLDLLRDHDVPGISLSVQRSSQAVKFYQRLGFTVLQEREEDYLLYLAL